MKKPYEKPVIFFENFSLSTNIAAGCDYKANLSPNSCGYEVRGGRVVFINETTGCTLKAPYDSSFQDYVYGSANNSICYHVPIETNNLFNS